MQISDASHRQNKISLTGEDLELLDSGGLQVLSALIGNPTTAKQIALRTGLGRARVKYLIDKLIERDVVTRLEEMPENARAEQYYKAVSNDIALELHGSQPSERNALAAQVVVSSLQTSLIARLARSEGDGSGPRTPAFLTHLSCRMPADQIRSFMERLREVAGEFAEAEDLAATTEFALTMALYEVADHTTGVAPEA